MFEFDEREWDAFVKKRGGHLLQTSRWGRLKATFGWEYEILTLSDGTTLSGGALVLIRPLPLGLGTIAYIPRGPIVDWDDGDTISDLLTALGLLARKYRAVLLKIEPDERDTPQMRERLQALGFRPSSHTIQPPRTILVDITGSEEDILARMNQGTRRKIRLAERRGVTVRTGKARDLDSFTALMQETAARNAFGVHSPAYYRQAYKLFAPTEQAVLLMASYEERDLAGLMAFALGRRAWYFYGASSDEERQRMPTYALQWEAIRWARRRGCTVYDMWGIPDADEEELEARFQHRHDGLWGVYGFKRGFGGQVVRTVGAWDRVYRPLLYTAYRAAVARRAGAGT